jgi:hypothetical protein
VSKAVAVVPVSFSIAVSLPAINSNAIVTRPAVSILLAICMHITSHVHVQVVRTYSVS